MGLKDEWKKAGSDLGHAFAGVGKNIGKSAKTCVDAVVEDETPQSNVFNDGSWRKAGKNLGRAFVGVGKAIVHSIDSVAEDDSDKK